jgi:hypothetical protein
MHSRERSWVQIVCAVAACAWTTSACGTQADEAGNDAAVGGGERFSFFVASYQALQALSGSEAGFGGDSRYGESGPGAGLRGPDKICTQIAERSMAGASSKRWRAFLSATAGENGKQVDAIDRIGEGPWYDRIGRVFALKKADLLNDRPAGTDNVIALDFPNEDGVPNQRPDPSQTSVNNHDILTGTSSQGLLYSATATCLDWTSAMGDLALEGRPRVGHSWDRMAGDAVVVPPTGIVRGDGGMLGFDGPAADGGVFISEGPDGGRLIDAKWVLQCTEKGRIAWVRRAWAAVDRTGCPPWMKPAARRELTSCKMDRPMRTSPQWAREAATVASIASRWRHEQAKGAALRQGKSARPDVRVNDPL